MADDKPKAGEPARTDEAKSGDPKQAPDPKPGDPRPAQAPAQAPHRKADRPAKGDDADPGDGDSSDASASAAAAKTSPPKRQKYGPMPGPKELSRIRKARFGDKPGTVRVDAAPANSGPDAEATMLVFVDNTGKVVGREAYVPGNYR